MALPKDFLREMVGPVLSDYKNANVNRHEFARLEALTFYGPRCFGCGDTFSDHLRVFAITTLESIPVSYLKMYGLPGQVLDRFNVLSPLVVLCPRCVRAARKDRKENPEHTPEAYRYTMQNGRAVSTKGV